MLVIRRAWFAIIDGKCSQDTAVLRCDRRRPTSSQPVRQREVAVRSPQRIIRNVGDDDWLASIGGSAAGSHARANLSAVDGLTVFSWQGRRSPVAQGLTLGI